MCDYSLAGVPNRLAVEGDQLTIYRFSTGAIGLTSACAGWKDIFLPSRRAAVCISPGARLRLLDIPRYLQERFGLAATENVSFVQKSAEAFTYRDAVRFKNGKELLLQHLRCGQRVDVLSLSPEDGDEYTRHEILEEEYRRLFAGDEHARASPTSR
jgi:hypothetical protein